jgi:hypothetical protein
MANLSEELDIILFDVDGESPPTASDNEAAFGLVAR